MRGLMYVAMWVLLCIMIKNCSKPYAQQVRDNPIEREQGARWTE
jgi:hypothetical protein